MQRRLVCPQNETRCSQEMWLTLYMTPLATVASISGHCPAGGCLLALSCDARVMAEGKYTIGLNEAKLGLVPPAWVREQATLAFELCRLAT